jgi:hypothetical protein
MDMTPHFFATIIQTSYSLANSLELLRWSAHKFWIGQQATYLSNMSKFTNHVTIAFNNFFLDIETKLAATLSGIDYVSLIQQAQSIPYLEISVRS